MFHKFWFSFSLLLFLQQRVMNCFRAWEDWALYPPKYLIKLQNIFLGLEVGEGSDENPFDGKPLVETPAAAPVTPVDAKPAVEDDDVDGIPSKWQVFFSSSLNSPGHIFFMGTHLIFLIDSSVDDDLDGEPMVDTTPASDKDSKTAPSVAFAPSRWETVDPEQVKAQGNLFKERNYSKFRQFSERHSGNSSGRLQQPSFFIF